MLDLFTLFFDFIIIFSSLIFIFLLILLENVNFFILILIIVFVIYKIIKLKKGGGRWFNQ